MTVVTLWGFDTSSTELILNAQIPSRRALSSAPHVEACRAQPADVVGNPMGTRELFQDYEDPKLP